MTEPAEFPKSTLNAAILAGCMIAFLGFGFSATFGVFLRPMSADLGWGREIFSLSVATQALAWGFTQPFAGMAADRYGTARVLAFGAICAALGFFLRGSVMSPEVFVFSGVIVGIGTGACSFPVVIAALSKVVSARQRSFVMGLGTASASLGMFAAAPATSAMINAFGWQQTILLISLSFVAILPFLIFVSRVSVPTASAQGAGAFGHAIKSAFADKSYLCLFFGFFVCGFHVAFIGTHLPAYIADLGLSALVGGWSLALIGLFNIAGSFFAGWSGQRHTKKHMLAGIYLTRAAVITVFIMTPVSPGAIYVFSAVMGLLWLSTVPFTMALVAQTQGLKYLSTLAGLVFLSHQIGSFTGAWLGGRIFDIYHSYTPMWWAAVVFGILAAIIHLPIVETRDAEPA
jgi:MFS family permease